MFSVRSLVVPMHEDVDAWLKFAGLCRKSGRQRQVQLAAQGDLCAGSGGHAGPNVLLIGVVSGGLEHLNACSYLA